MIKQRPNGDQLIRFLLLSFAAVLLYQHFFGPKQKQAPTDKRNVPALVEAFKGIENASVPQSAATAEIKTLNEAIEKDGKDEYSDWARLRKGLLEQYILQDAGAAKKTYKELTDKGGKDVADAQGLYQYGDLLWRESAQGDDKKASSESVTAIEQLVHRGRGSSAFLDKEIFVARDLNPSDPITKIPPRFEKVKVGDLKGDLTGSDPQGILYRVDQYYRHHDPYYFYYAFDLVVRWFGNQPAYSYGLAILFFAIFTRILIQPITKKQYESMKGMQVVAPEMKKVQDKYKGQSDPQTQQQMYKEIRAIYQSHGVSPMMGCVLGLIQMPLFFLVIYPLIQHFEARMELAGASFLWIHSLAHPDIPILIAYAISMFLSFRLSSTPPTDDQQRMMQMMMSFVFPFVFPFFMASYPSAFILYWMTYNVLSTIFQWRMLKAADPDKNVIKTLLGRTPAVGVDPADATAISPDAVPPRPVLGKKKVRTLTVEADAVTAEPVSANGHSNGTHPSEELAVVEISKDSSSKSGRSSSRRSQRRRRH